MKNHHRTATPDIDLEIKVKHTKNAGSHQLNYILTGAVPIFPFRSKEYPAYHLEKDPVAFSHQLLTNIDLYCEGRNSDVSIINDFGRQLFGQLLPDEIQDLLWCARNRNYSLLIDSNETHIPWHMLKLFGERDGSIIEGPFLCEAYEFTQWTTHQPLKTTIKLQPMLVTAGKLNKQETIAAEFRAITGYVGAVKAKRPGRVELQNLLAEGSFNAWHFIGHGSSPGSPTEDVFLHLANNDVIGPDQISGPVNNMRKTNPIVVLNCCHGARGGVSLSESGGWSRAMLNAGACAYISTSWSVNSQMALHFAEYFYGQLVSGVPLAEAMQNTRKFLKSKGGVDWLCYNLYGHPLAAVSKTMEEDIELPDSEVEQLWSELKKEELALGTLAFLAVLREPVTPELLKALTKMDPITQEAMLISLQKWLDPSSLTQGKIWLKTKLRTFLQSSQCQKDLDMGRAELRIVQTIYHQSYETKRIATSFLNKRNAIGQAKKQTNLMNLAQAASHRNQRYEYSGLWRDLGEANPHAA